MKKNNLYIMIGLPGSGKSTFIKTNLNNCFHVSRDTIRFTLVENINSENYFSKEDEVYNEFIETIYNVLKTNNDVVADATHLNKKSRKKLLNSLADKGLDLKKINIIPIYIAPPVEICLKRNENRKKTLFYVPPQVIKKMFLSLTKPDFKEYNNIYKEIWTVYNWIIPESAFIEKKKRKKHGLFYS